MTGPGAGDAPTAPAAGPGGRAGSAQPAGAAPGPTVHGFTAADRGVLPGAGAGSVGPVVDDREALQRVLAAVGPLPAFAVGLADAAGCTLAAPVHAPGDWPAVALARWAGYAVRTADLAPGVELTVVADAWPGPVQPVRVQPGFCVRIAAGAALPPGADAVLPVAATDGGVSRARLLGSPVRPGDGVEPAGAQARAGGVLLPLGAPLGAAALGLAAAAGCASVTVHPRPRVVVAAVGEDSVDVGAPVQPGQHPDVASHLLAAAAREAGAQAYRVATAGGSAAAVAAALEDHLIRADVVLLAGHTGAAPVDLVRDVLARTGTATVFPLRLEPVGWFVLGALGPDAVPVLGVPADPVAALVAFELLVRPALRRMLGAEPLLRPQLTAQLSAAHPGPAAGGRVAVPVTLTRDGAGSGWLARPLTDPGHTLAGALGAATGLALLDTPAAAGAPVPVALLERRGR